MKINTENKEKKKKKCLSGSSRSAAGSLAMEKDAFQASLPGEAARREPGIHGGLCLMARRRNRRVVTSAWGKTQNTKKNTVRLTILAC